jgi:hypothetical protein
MAEPSGFVIHFLYRMNNAVKTIDITPFNVGIYFLTLSSKQGNTVKKIVKQ